MSEVLDTLVRFFTEDGWDYARIEGQPVLQLRMRGENGRWSCFAQAIEEQARFAFYSECPVNAPVQKLLAMAEFLTRANYGLVIGNFEMDFEDGAIRFKTSIDVEGDRLSPALVQQLVYANVFTMDRYLPGIMKVIYGDASPAEALVEIEG